MGCDVIFFIGTDGAGGGAFCIMSFYVVTLVQIDNMEPVDGRSRIWFF